MNKAVITEPPPSLSGVIKYCKHFKDLFKVLRSKILASKFAVCKLVVESCRAIAEQFDT